VWRTQIKPGVKDSDLFILKNIRKITSRTERNRESKSSLSLRKNTKLLRNGKYTMSVIAFNEFERHRGGAAYGVKVTAGGTKTAFATERNIFKFSAMPATVNSVTVIEITAVQHLFDIFKNGIANENAGGNNSIKPIVKNLL